MIEYVLCVARDEWDDFIFVEKDHPSWQMGLLNFPGGKVNEGEKHRDAAAREFLEEVGVTTKPDDWMIGLVLQGPDYRVHVCYALKHQSGARTMTGEEVLHVGFKGIFEDVSLFVHNVPWMAALALDRQKPGILLADYRSPPMDAVYIYKGFQVFEFDGEDWYIARTREEVIQWRMDAERMKADELAECDIVPMTYGNLLDRSFTTESGHLRPFVVQFEEMVDKDANPQMLASSNQ